MQMRCAQIRHRALFKRLRIFGWGVWGGRSLPQGHSPNDMVICVSNLPYWMVFRGPLGVLGGSFGGPGGPVGVQGGQRASWEGLGGFQEGSGRVQGGV